jgi:hypothetical protein
MKTRALAEHLLAALSVAGIGAIGGCSTEPWSDKLESDPSMGKAYSRMCLQRSQLFPDVAPERAGQTPCPETKALIDLGHFTPTPEPAMAGSVLAEGPVEWEGQCCYLLAHWHTGRALEVGGASRVAKAIVRDDWSCAEDVAEAHADDSLDEVDRATLAQAWAADGLLEHASVASFSRFALELLALGAPRSLLMGAHQAALDEVEHARECFELASRYAGRALGPGRLLLDGVAPRCDLFAATAAAIREGCIGETEAALLAQAQLEGATDPQVRRTLERIARDEADHAALAWRFVAWALSTGGPEARQAIEAELASYAARTESGTTARSEITSEARVGRWRAHGRLSSDQIERVRRAAHTDVIAPCARALLG